MLCNAGKRSSELSKALVPLDAEYLLLLVWSLGKGTPRELRTLYRLVPKCTRIPNVALAWEGPRCPNHLEIPGPNSWNWAVSLAAGTHRGWVPEGAVSPCSGPTSKSIPGETSSSARWFTVEKESANASQVGQERRAAASQGLK